MGFNEFQYIYCLTESEIIRAADGASNMRTVDGDGAKLLMLVVAAKITMEIAMMSTGIKHVFGLPARGRN
jgi:hypothetical protein